MSTAPEQIALHALELAQARRFAEIHALLAAQLQAMVVPEALEADWTAALDEHGAVVSVGAPVSEPRRRSRPSSASRCSSSRAAATTRSPSMTT